MEERRTAPSEAVKERLIGTFRKLITSGSIAAKMALSRPLESCSRKHSAALLGPIAKTRQRQHSLCSSIHSIQALNYMRQLHSPLRSPIQRGAFLGRALRTSCDQQPNVKYPQRWVRIQDQKAPAAKLTLDKETRAETKHGGDHEELELPPRSLGLPIIGETLDLIKSQNPANPDAFSGPRQAKYGKIFKSNALGRNFITVSGPEAAAQILTNGERPKDLQSCNPILGSGNSFCRQCQRFSADSSRCLEVPCFG